MVAAGSGAGENGIRSKTERKTMPTTAQKLSFRRIEGQPAWKLAEYLPPQGHWWESDYLALDSSIENQRTIELANGFLEFLPMPTIAHEDIVQFLFLRLYGFAQREGRGAVYFAGAKSRLWEGTIRLPDILFVLAEHKNRRDEDCFFGADLVMEVVSKGAKDRKRDLVDKRHEYAKAGIREYWIVDPERKQFTVLKLSPGKGKYDVNGEFKKGQRASSALLKGFEVDVSDALAGLKQ